MTSRSQSPSDTRQNGQNQRQQRQNTATTTGTPDNGSTPPGARRSGAGSSLSVPGYAQAEAPSLVETLADSGVPEEIERLVLAELNQDHILANLNEAEMTWRRYTLLNNLEMVLASFPPRESIWQGQEMRQEAGLDDGRRALTPEQVHQLRDVFDAAYERATRSREGWQQRLLAEQQSERRIIEEREEEQENKGWLAKVLG